ncbi:MAG TPA: radical SAM protein [Anaerolineae bacterium]|nr:radical SAM protein [Anaerolineae bacterium]
MNEWEDTGAAIAFGPVPSRRLGRSLGINNVPPKVCSYSCVYCQLGRTTKMGVERQLFYDPQMVSRSVEEKVAQAGAAGEQVDYLSFVPDGEPTLDVNLGREIDLLRPLGITIAVISNSSLVWRADVRDDLRKADWVSLKIDSAREEIWRQIDQPHAGLKWDLILEGMAEFAQAFEGKLTTETMLIRGVNDSAERVAEVAQFVSRLRPSVAYLSIPTRPPAEEWVKAPAEEDLNRAYYIMSEGLDSVEYLIGYEGDAFASTGNVEEDLLSITAVHPMRRDAVRIMLSKAKADWSVVEGLVSNGSVVETEYEGCTYYVKRIR